MQPRDDYYASGNPQAGDVLLIIEVADSTLDFDRNIKGPMYALDGIGEYWLVNLNDKSVEVYRRPTAEGTYGEMHEYHVGDSISPAALPDFVVKVGQFLA